MARLDDLETALRNADSAGDTEAAKTLAAEYQAEAQRMQTPSTGAKFMQSIAQAAPGGLPAMAAAGTNALTGPMNELYKQGTYAAGGKVTDIASGFGASPEVAGALGYGTNVGLQALPVLLAGQLGKSAAPQFREGGRKLMTSALKPTFKQHETGEAKRAVETMLKEGINATEGGVRHMKNEVASLNRAITDKIALSNANVNKWEAGRPVAETFSKMRKQVNPASDLEAVRKGFTEFMTHPDLAKKSEFPVQLAQELKKGTYRQLEGKYGELGSAAIETQKALARGLRQEISKAVPAVESLNRREGDLISALNVAERRVMMDLNKNPGGLAWLTESPARFAAFMADKSALFKSLLARALYSGAERIPQAAAMGATAIAESPD